MRKLLIGVIVTFVLSFPVARTRAGQYQSAVQPETKMLKARQKQEWKTLKLQEKYQKHSWKGQHLSKATRAQMKHQPMTLANMGLQRLKPRLSGSGCGGAEAPPFRFLTRHDSPVSGQASLNF